MTSGDELKRVLENSDLLSLLSPDQVALEIDSGMLTTISTRLTGGRRTIGITTREGWRPTRPQARLVALIEEAARATRVKESL